MYSGKNITHKKGVQKYQMSSCWYSHSFGQTVGGQKSSKTSACSKTLWDDKSYKLKQRCLTPPSYKRTLSSSNNIWRHLPEVMNQFSNALKFRISTMNYFFYGQLLNMNCIFSWRKFQKVADSKKFWLWISKLPIKCQFRRAPLTIVRKTKYRVNNKII